MHSGPAAELDPHANPDGQHPPPAVSAQLNQPFAHLTGPVAVVGSATTIVRLFDVKVDEESAGHDVVSQLRPVRQQPPW
ncbi:hypothetical protein MPDQ_000674 [Monascus purpureus]|uniref:Uncharacterized protein n=1 Tax=Monascus purpureus TaxID=5098 RepID=A0A507QPD7_MONPU|nr:hypothetical protein MPDQ_000674 [Monascus purpureus]